MEPRFLPNSYQEPMLEVNLTGEDQNEVDNLSFQSDIDSVAKEALSNRNSFSSLADIKASQGLPSQQATVQKTSNLANQLAPSNPFHSPSNQTAPSPKLTVNEALEQAINEMLPANWNPSDPASSERYQIKIKGKLVKKGEEYDLKKFTNGQGFKLDCEYTIEITDSITGKTTKETLTQTLCIAGNDKEKALKLIKKYKNLFAAVALQNKGQSAGLVASDAHALAIIKQVGTSFRYIEGKNAFQVVSGEKEPTAFELKLNKSPKPTKEYLYNEAKKTEEVYKKEQKAELRVTDQRLNRVFVTKSEKMEFEAIDTHNKVTLRSLNVNLQRPSGHINDIKTDIDSLERKFKQLKTGQTPFVDYRFKFISKWEKESEEFNQMLEDIKAIKQAELGTFIDDTGTKLYEKPNLSEDARKYIKMLSDKSMQAELQVLQGHLNLVSKKIGNESLTQLETDTVNQLFSACGKAKPEDLMASLQQEMEPLTTQMKSVKQDLADLHEKLILNGSQKYIDGRYKLMRINSQLQNTLKHAKAFEEELQTAYQNGRENYQFEIERLKKLEKTIKGILKDQQNFLTNLDKQMGQVFFTDQ